MCSQSPPRCQTASGTATPQDRSAHVICQSVREVLPLNTTIFLARKRVQRNLDTKSLWGYVGNRKLRKWHTCDVKATEKSRMQAEMMERVSCAQKLNQPMRRQASDALARAFLATSETAGLVLRGSSSAEVFALATVACTLCKGHLHGEDMHFRIESRECKAYLCHVRSEFVSPAVC